MTHATRGVVAQPTGVVTLVFTDVEGSTRLLHSLGADAYRDLLAEHLQTVRDAFDRHGGYEVDNEGDSLFFAFSSARGAVAAVAEAQDRLSGGAVTMRAGVHTGQPSLDPPKYVGIDVHKAARIMSVGHGGQTLLSRATRELVEADVVDLGEHRLRDIDAPVHLYQLGRVTFPPVKTVGNNNLPRSAVRLVGRDQAVGDVVALLTEHRLVTVTGPGGIGKTRFALEVAHEQLSSYAAGVWWVPLEAVRDSHVVLDTVAQRLGATTSLDAHIGDRAMLLVLDNLEQVIDAAGEIAALVRACPNLVVLATSRELLCVQGEKEYRLPPLETEAAVDLFCQRSGYDASDVIGTLCTRLDGLPLALELAAARSRVLTPDQLLERLSQRLDLLKGGRDADPRQLTLRAAIQWSYDLLTIDEQRLFTALGVFDGGCTLDAAERVCAADIDVLQSLHDKNLLLSRSGRYSMLESVREFARERIEQLPNAHQLHRRHAEWALDLARSTRDALEGKRAQAVALAYANDELANLRAALAWSMQHDPPTMLELVANLDIFFWRNGLLTEALSWVEVALDTAPEHQTPSARAGVLEAGSWLAGYVGDHQRLAAYATEAVELRRRGNDARALGRALRELAKHHMHAGDRPSARAALEEAADLSRSAGDEWNLAICLNNLGDHALYEADYDIALARCTESYRIRETRGDDWGCVITGGNRALAMHRLGRNDEAREQIRDVVRLADRINMPYYLAEALMCLAAIELEGEPELAAFLLGASDALAADTEEAPQELEDELWQTTRVAVKDRLGPDDCDARISAGRAAGRQRAVDVALGAASP